MGSERSKHFRTGLQRVTPGKYNFRHFVRLPHDENEPPNEMAIILTCDDLKSYLKWQARSKKSTIVGDIEYIGEWRGPFLYKGKEVPQAGRFWIITAYCYMERNNG